MNHTPSVDWIVRMSRGQQFRGRVAGAFATALALTAGLVSPASATVLVDIARLVGDPAASASQEFDVPRSGRYEVRLTDLGFPEALARVEVSVTRGSQLVTSLPAAGEREFDAVAGSHAVHVSGVAAATSGAGTYGVQVLPAGGGDLVLDYSDSITAELPPDGGATTTQSQFTITNAGTHRVTLSDAAFPEPLQSVDVLVTRGGIEYARLDAVTNVREFDGPAGTYDVLAIARPGATSGSGLYGIAVVLVATSEAVFDENFPVGRLNDVAQEAGPGLAVDLPADGRYALEVSDLQFPAPLAFAGAAVVRGATILATQAGSGTVAFDTAAGEVILYTIARAADDSSAGSQSARILQGDRAAASVVTTLDAADGSEMLSREVVPITAAGRYRTTLTDFEFPAALARLQIAVVQNGSVVASRTGSGTLDVQGVAGPMDVLVAARPASTSQSGLYAVNVVAEPGGSAVLDSTHAVGARLDSQPLDVSSAGSYDIITTDLGFPARFVELALAVTRGNARVGTIYGGGRLSFEATPGRYYLNVVARLDPTLQFGTYGLKVETTPPRPVLSFAASPTSIESGGTVRLTWSVTNASACVASDGWSGDRPLSGSATTPALTVDTRFTLTCSGPGGSDSRTVMVTIRPPESGGGAAGPPLLLLLLLAAVRLATRDRTSIR